MIIPLAILQNIKNVEKVLVSSSENFIKDKEDTKKKDAKKDEKKDIEKTDAERKKDKEKEDAKGKK